jgi:hypothetical protein
MEIRLSKKVSSEKVNKVLDFRKWLNGVRRCDEVFRAEREEYEQIPRDNRESSCRTSVSNEPSSRRIPNQNNNPSTSSSSTAANSATIPAPCKQCLKLLDSERKLLNKNNGCLKCRKFFVEHRAVNCPNNFPNPATYRSITQADVDRFKRTKTRGIAAVVSTQYAADTLPTTSESTVHPVAAMLEMSHNPVAYLTPNASSVIEPNLDNSGDLSVSPMTICAPLVAMPLLKEVAPLHVPHLYWRCLTSSKSGEFPVIMRVLIDHGSDAVLISEPYAE